MFEAMLEKRKKLLGDNNRVYFSPGRVNLIGEHIDYLGGYVLPVAIQLGTYGFVSRREDDKLVLCSENFPNEGEYHISLDHLSYNNEDKWANYVKGVFKLFIDKGYAIDHGLNILIYGTLPHSSGLSSSASLELLICKIIQKEYQIDIDTNEMVQLSMDVENHYLGLQSGIMDQFIIGNALKNHAIYLNTNTLNYEQVPLNIGKYKLLIANSNKKRKLTDSKYNERVLECKNAIKVLQNNGIHIEQICDLRPKDLPIIQSIIKDNTVLNRVKHAVLENERTKAAVTCLKSGNMIQFGSLLVESHNSLRDLYEVSCLELDELVEAFLKNGAIGARMTGAGFGGCVIAFVLESNIETVIKEVKKHYLDTFGYETDIYVVETSDGVRQI